MPSTLDREVENGPVKIAPRAETPTMDSSFESWGRYPKYKAHVVPMHWQRDFPANITGLHNGALAVGMGRSYGDVCLLKEGNLLVTTGMNRLLLSIRRPGF